MSTPASTSPYDDLPVHERPATVASAEDVTAYAHLMTPDRAKDFSDLGRFVSHRRFPYMATVGYRDRTGVEQYVTGPIRGAVLFNGVAVLHVGDLGIDFDCVTAVATDEPVDPELAKLKAPRG